MSTSFSHQPCRRNDSVWYCLDAMIYGAVLWLQALRVFCQSFSSPPSPYAGRFWDGLESEFCEPYCQERVRTRCCTGRCVLVLLDPEGKGDIFET
jgi:hypothetical protein